MRADLARRQKRSFGLVAGLLICLLLISLAASWAAIKVVDATRAYATGEGRYSKAQKIAVIDLQRYAYSGLDQDYQAFLEATAMPRGDRAARLALEATHVDTAAARAGFLRGANHPDDVGSLINLFRLFGWWGPFAAAVADWHEGDALVANLIELGRELHDRIVGGTLDAAGRIQLLGDVDRLDDRLTSLENTFSTHMGEAARGATTLVVLGLGATTIVLWSISLVFATRLLRRQLSLDRQLAFSEVRFRDYAEVASDWYWETDSDDRIVFLSERFFADAGAAALDALGQDAGKFIVTHAAGETPTSTLAAIAGRRPFRDLRLRFARADGSPGYWSLAGKPHEDADGQFRGFRGVGTDITTAVNDAEILHQAKDRAEVASHAKSEFLANMSHELRTPLNAILGFSEIIMKRQFGPKALDRYADYAGDIHVSGRHLLAIIDDILDLSKVEAGHDTLEENEIGIAEIAQRSHRLLGDRFEHAGLNLTFELPEPAPSLYVDERKLKQAVVNLLSNALKFTPRGGTVTLAVVYGVDGGLGLAVRDTGIGIDAKDVHTVMLPFGQIESAFQREHHGTGLGLPLARSLIELHGGRLTLASEVGVGTIVTLWLPPHRVIEQSVPRFARVSS